MCHAGVDSGTLTFENCCKPVSPPVSSGAGPIIHQHPAVSSTQDARKSRLAQLEAEQEKVKEERLMQLDAGCWQDMAEHGLFQKAEDLLTSAADLEEKKVGQTERYATLMHALGALYDFRSNVDVTGQQQMLSLKSAKFAERAVKVLHALVAKSINDQIMGINDGATAEDGNRLSEQLAKSLLMRGKSLCNTALDGSPSLEMTAESAFDDAERDVKDAAAIREKLRHNQLAEAVMAVGYVYYCRACRVLNSPDADSVVGQIDYMEQNYTMALEHYKRSLQMYIERVGNEHADSIRMRCNIALVYNVMSRMPCEKRMEYIVEAEEQYREVLKTQEKVFGKRHQRTQRLEIDLQNIEERKAQM
jgi:tetratricopeptide (TPR) repeat protein